MVLEMKQFEEQIMPEMAEFFGFGQKTKLFDIADGSRLLYFQLTHPKFSPVGLRFQQPITLLQSVFLPAANFRSFVCTHREYLVLRLTVRSFKPETHRQFRPPAS